MFLISYLEPHLKICSLFSKLGSNIKYYAIINEVYTFLAIDVVL